MKIEWDVITLQLEGSFTIAKGSYSERRALIVQLSQDGCTGYGEATEITYYGVDLDRLRQTIADHADQLSGIELTSPAQYYRDLQPILGHEPFLLSAFDCAGYDLYGRLTEQRILDFLNPDTEKALHTTFTIGLGTIEDTLNKIKATPWPRYKVKLNGDDDLERISAIRTVTQAPLLLDPNEGWSFEHLSSLLEPLAHLNILALEQPIHRSMDAQLGQLKEQSQIPFVADESCHGIADVVACQASYHGINIKLMKCGGITPALQMIARARQLGLMVMIGCMTESTIGISAAMQLIPQVDLVDLDGAMLLANDLAKGSHFVDGVAEYSDTFGLGFEML